jgi:hypothetical protein
VVTKGELTGWPYAQRLVADRELFGKLSIKQLEILAAESQALVDKAWISGHSPLVIASNR